MKSFLLPWIKLLTFRMTPDEWNSLDVRYLQAGLALTWLAGIGRHWDDPRAILMQQSGLGSVVYVVALSAFLWLLSKPLHPDKIQFRRLFTFVTLTSPPALLYALPVEKWTTMATANTINFWFLAIVSLWRVALLRNFFKLSGFSDGRVFLATFLPLGFIVFTLFSLNLQHVVVNIMGGIRDADKSVHDGAYTLLFLLTALSIYITPFLALGWIYLVATHHVVPFVRLRLTGRKKPEDRP